MLVAPNEDQKLLIQKALHEDIKNANRDLEIIKRWLVQEPHLPDTWSELGLMNFLRGSNFSLERCKQRVDKYFSIRASAPEFFKNRDVNRQEFENLKKFFTLVTLPNLTPDGKRINMAISICDDNSDPQFIPMFKYTTMMCDMRLLSEENWVTGELYILDLRKPCLKVFLKTPLFTFQKFFALVQEAYPLKIKEVHVIHNDPFVQIIFKALKPFLKAKLISRLHFHPDLESLHKVVPKKLLPEEYGGFGGTVAELDEEWRKWMRDFGDWFKTEEAVMSDESKRIGYRRDDYSVFGTEGSFKQLTVD